MFANIFIGLIIMNISDSQQKHEKMRRRKSEIYKREKEKILRKQAEELSEMIGKDKTGELNQENFEELVKSYFESITHDNLIRSNKLCANLTWIKCFLKTLKCFDDQLFIVKNLHYEMTNVLSEIAEARLKEEIQNKEQDSIEN